MIKKEISKMNLRKIQLNILKTIHSICEENNITYYICSGTLLGAVRHKGYIPWDDDIDIMLLRDDYEKLIKILKKQEKFRWLGILDHNCKGYYYPFAKAVDNRTVAKMEDNLTDHGIWVDIFPCDNLPDNKIIRYIFVMKNFFKRSVVMSMTTDFSSNQKIRHWFIKKMLNIYSKTINKQKYAENYYNYEKKYCKKTSNYIGIMFSQYKLKECFDLSLLGKPQLYSFENEKFYGPSKAHEYLEHLYGNYMELPPKNERKDHKIIAWYK